MQTFRAELLSKLYFVRRIHIAESGDMLGLDGEQKGARIIDFQSGNRMTPRAPNPDNL
jgi:hypothetical protein